jgi:hypothetical protein
MADNSTWDPTVISQHATLEDADTTVHLVLDTDPAAAVRSVFVANSGKWYCELYIPIPAPSGVSTNTNSDFVACVGLVDYTVSPVPDDPKPSEYLWGYVGNGNKVHNGTEESYGQDYIGDPGDDHAVIGIAIDLDNGKLFFSFAGDWQAGGDPEAGTNPAYTIPTGQDIYVLVTSTGDIPYGDEYIVTAHFSVSTFTYTPPAGFDALDAGAVNYLQGELAPINGSLVAQAKLFGDIPTIVGIMGVGGILAGEIPTVTGFISGLNNTGYITDTVGLRYIKSLPPIEGSIKGSSQLYGELPTVVGGILGSSKFIGDLPAIQGALTGLVGAKGSITRNLPAIVGDLTGTAPGVGYITGILHPITGALAGESGNKGNIGKPLPVIRGSITGYGFDSGFITGRIWLRGSLHGGPVVPHSITGTVPPITGTLHGITGIRAELAGKIGVYGFIYASQHGKFDYVILEYSRRSCG